MRSDRSQPGNGSSATPRETERRLSIVPALHRCPSSRRLLPGRASDAAVPPVTGTVCVFGPYLMHGALPRGTTHQDWRKAPGDLGGRKGAMRGLAFVTSHVTMTVACGAARRTEPSLLDGW